MKGARIGWALAALAVGCQTQAPSSSPTSFGQAAARVGAIPVAASLIGNVATASAESPRRALEDIVSDALAASAARASGLDHGAGVRWATDTALARQVARQSLREAAAEGAPSPDELETLEVAHAVVLRSAKVPQARAVTVAEAILRSVEGARSIEDFEARAKATPHADSQVVVERLAPFGADGRSTSPGTGEIDASFVAAAFSLHAPGQLSPVVETRFGWHVIFLIGRVPPSPADVADRRAALESAVAELRARGWLASRLRALKQRSRIEIFADADALMAQAKVLP